MDMKIVRFAIKMQENDCPDINWGEWSPCSVTCGNGTKERERTNEENDDEQSQKCTRLKETVECYNLPCIVMEVTTDDLIEVTESLPDGPVIDCKVTRWSEWSTCNTSLPCQKRYRFKERFIQVHSQNGGKPCPSILRQKKRCKCTSEKVPSDTEPSNTDSSSEDQKVDCVMGRWSQWSPCTTSCGPAVQQRTRSIVVYPSENGKPCKSRIQERSCRLPLSCTGILPIV